jgi:sigma-B regulation protein RsbU (phosphoserine phosphatase)
MMEPGDLLAIYSDGVTEAQSPKEDEFGEDRFGEVLATHRTQSAVEVMDAVNAALVVWSEGGPPADDITLVVAKRV